MVVISYYFFLVTGVLFNLYTLNSTEVTLSRCLLACYQDQSCGGIIYHEKESFKCEFVVESTIAGATLSSSKNVYRLDMYGGNRLFETVTVEDTFSWNDTDKLCRSYNLLMPNFPVTAKQRTILTLRTRTRYLVDLKRQTDGSYQNSEGEVTNPDIIKWNGNNPHFGEKFCIKLLKSENEDLAYDFGCEMKQSATVFSILCV